MYPPTRSFLLAIGFAIVRVTGIPLNECGEVCRHTHFGSYHFSALSPGNYSLKVTQKGGRL